MKLTEQELYNITGGGELTSTMINAASRLISTLLYLGQVVGSAIRRGISGKCCKI